MTTAWLTSHLGFLVWTLIVIGWLYFSSDEAQEALGRFISVHFDKLLLASFIFVYVILPLHLVGWIGQGEPSPLLAQIITGMLDDRKTILGALITLVTGRALMRSSDNRKGNGEAPPPAPTAEPPK